MKKITLVLLAFILSWQINAQVNYTYGWEPTTLGGWVSGGSSGSFSRNTTTPCEGVAGLRANTYFGGASTITSPSLGTSNSGMVTFSFDYKVTEYDSNSTGASAADFTIKLERASSTSGPWYEVGLINGDNHTVAATCATKTFTFTPAAGSLFVRLTVQSTPDADLYTYFDNISVVQGEAPSCVAPTGIVASNLGSATATLSWAAALTAPANGYEYYYSTSNEAPTAAGTASAGLTASVTGLLENTQYYVWVRSMCAEPSAWNGPVSFRTLCTSFAVPFFEKFNSDSANKSCWTVLNANADADAWNLSYATSPIEGNQSAMMFTDGNGGLNDDWLISPKITLTGAEQLSFKYKAQSANEPNDFRVVLSTTGNAPADFTNVIVPLMSTTGTAAVKHVVSLAGYTGDVFVAWHVPAGGLDGWRLYIDDVAFEPIPTAPPLCIEDMNAVVNEGCGNFATTFTWAAVTGADGYKVSIGTSPNGADLVINDANIGNVLNYSFSGNAGTTYYYTIKPWNTFGSAINCFEDSFTTYDDGCYCVSLPTSNDGAGISSVQINDTTTPVSDVMYANFTENGAIDITQNVTTVMNITFATLATYGTHIWIDYNDNYTFEASELVYSGESGNTNPFVLNTSFLTSATAALGEHRMRIVATDVVQTVPNPCYSGSWGVSLDFLVNVLEAPSCLPPTASSASAITASSALLSWVSTGTTFNVEYDFAGSSQGAGTVISGVTGNSTTLTNLDPQTNYAYYVQTDCGNGNLSPWTGPFLFKTGCDSFGDFSEDFTTESTIVAPDCWYTLVNSTVSTPKVSVSEWNDYVSLATSGNPAAVLYLITPSLSDLPLDTHRIKFKARGPALSNLIIGTMTDPSNEATFTAVQTIPMTTAFANYALAFVNSTTDMHIAFKFAGTASYQTLDIDDVVWETAPACPEIYVVTFVSSTPTTADISWAPGGLETSWQYAYGPSTLTSPDDLTPIDVSTPNVTITTGLVPSSLYKIWVRATCGANFGEWSPAKTFTTACVPVTNLPWTEGFEGLTTLNSTTFPPCWFKENGDWSTTNETSFNVPRNGSNYLRCQYAANNEYMWTPAFELTAGTSYDFSFYMAGDGYSGWDVSVYHNATQSSTGATQLGATVEAPNVGSSYAIQPYTLVKNTIVPTTSGVYYFAVKVNQPGFPWYIAFDDFKMEVTPSCVAPTAPTATNVTISTATINWTATATPPANGYEYFYTDDLEVMPNAATVALGTVAAGITTADLTGLLGSSVYKVYVRSLCAADDISSWSEAGTFVTSCINANLPYTINFENAVAPAVPFCTYLQNAGSGNNWKTTVNPGFGFTTTTLTYSYSSSSNANAWFFTNTVSLVAGTDYSVTYDFGNDGYYTEKLKVAYGATSNTAAMTTELANHPTIVSGFPETNTVTFSPTVSGDYVIGFNAYSDADQNLLYLDNILIQEVLSSASFGNNSFTAYPNPVKDMLNVSFTQNISDVTVYNLLGQKVLFLTMNANQGQVDMSNLTSGTYLVKVNAENGVKTIKVIKE